MSKKTARGRGKKTQQGKKKDWNQLTPEEQQQRKNYLTGRHYAEGNWWEL